VSEKPGAVQLLFEGLLIFEAAPQRILRSEKKPLLPVFDLGDGQPVTSGGFG
jgi:hypothetical protein